MLEINRNGSGTNAVTLAENRPQHKRFTHSIKKNLYRGFLWNCFRSFVPSLPLSYLHVPRWIHFFLRCFSSEQLQCKAIVVKVFSLPLLSFRFFSLSTSSVYPPLQIVPKFKEKKNLKFKRVRSCFYLARLHRHSFPNNAIESRRNIKVTHSLIHWTETRKNLKENLKKKKTSN